MSNEQQQKPQRQADRTPIKIKRLMFHSDKPTMMGIRVPQGPESKSEEQRHDMLAGIHGQDKIEIDYRPWLRAFRIARFRKQTSTGPSGEIESWTQYGDPFFVSDTWAVWVPVEDM